jgi:cytochrome c oxidase subunit 2
MRTAARRWSIRTAIVFALVVLGTLLTGTTVLADASGQPKGITEEAHKMHDLYILVLAIALAVFFAVEAALLFIIFKFRRKPGETGLPTQLHGNNAIEVLWTAIPVVIVIVLFVFSFIVLVDIDDKAEPEALTVEVQGFQFSWEFTYCRNDLGNGGSDAPEKAEDAAYKGPCASEADEVSVIGTGSEEPTLVIPVGEPVEFKLKSDDVIHSFYVRDFLYKLDVIPGRDNSFKVTATETGTFDGQCAELCGVNHALMRFKLEVKTRAEFDAYIATLSAGKAAAAAAAK